MLAFSLTLVGCAGVDQTKITFDNASVRLPENVFGEYAVETNAMADEADSKFSWQKFRVNYDPHSLDKLTEQLPPGKTLPVIVYFHGCAGMTKPSTRHIRLLATLDDFVVIGPDSFARPRPEYCFGNRTVDWNVQPQVVKMRYAEIHEALTRVAGYPWVDKANIFLIGHSQGGGIVASYAGAVRVRGRIILNGACGTHNGGNGLRDDEVVLTFDAGRDPWFTKFFPECRNFVRNHPNGKSIWEPKGTTHDTVLKHWPVVWSFLKDNRIQ